MPNIARKLLIFAAVDGLILQPSPPRNHPPSTQQAIKIDWNGNVAPLLQDRREADTGAGLEAWGIVGLLKVASTHFLISIASREQVAQIRGKPVYVISDVALIPLASQGEAEKAIATSSDSLKRNSSADTAVEEDSSEDDGDTATVTDDESLPDTLPPSSRSSIEQANFPGQKRERRTSIGQDVIARKGQYGRFAERWFSRKGWSYQGRQRQGISSEDDIMRKRKPEDNPEDTRPRKDEVAVQEALTLDQEMDTGKLNDEDGPPLVRPEEIPEAIGQAPDSSSTALLPKILRTTKIYFGSKSFYFSYDIDLSRRLATQPMAPSSQPLFKQFDPLYFWNQNMAKPFIDAGQDSFVLPLLQGFVGQRAFSVDTSGNATTDTVVRAASSLQAVLNKSEEAARKEMTCSDTSKEHDTRDFLLTIVSRRSVKRAGLRYLRRGVDGEGNVANSVETEQLLSSPTWDAGQSKIYSFTQCRGSIPLFFSQSPYSLKPWPVLHASQDMNSRAFQAHFADLISRYGKVQAASLVDKHGSEAKIGESFEKNATILNEGGGVDGKGATIGFEWFDFHNVCRGMKFENVSVLMDTLRPFLETSGWTIQEGIQLTSTQSGVLRTNCMDCLDRTNVVQSACARSALEAQLAAQDVTIDLQTDPRTAWFNTLWADNGDAISRQYSGTAALKGDYTRTRRRQISGALTDFGLTLTRYYNNIVNDYFAQALIDYLLGRASESIFAEFEADMKTTDYAIDLRKVRQGAIDRCAEIVIENKEEDFIAGWTLSCPAEDNTFRALPFEECVLLLTEKALYACRLDWETEKVKQFERIEVDDILSIQRGTYITSTLANRHMDTTKNVGLVVRYLPGGGKEMIRRNTRSLDNSHTDAGTTEPSYPARLLAFKALPPSSTTLSTPQEDEPHQPPSETETTRHIAEDIARVATKTKGDKVEVEEKDIIGLAEAKKATGWVETLGYNLKRLVWT